MIKEELGDDLEDIVVAPRVLPVIKGCRAVRKDVVIDRWIDRWIDR